LPVYTHAHKISNQFLTTLYSQGHIGVIDM
jgi:hypothetical protein